MRTCILVLGMHRSGTSALTRVLNLLGAQLPTHLLGAQLGNDAGHWEPRRLLALHDELLAAAGSSWDGFRPLQLTQIAPAALAQFKQRIKALLLEEYGDAPLFIVKDPRICRFVPFFTDLLAEMGISVRVALTLRNPVSVAASLTQRNGFSQSFGALLWLRHQLEAETASRPFDPFHLQFETLLAEPADTVQRLREWMEAAGIVSATPDHEIVASLRSDLTHFNHSPAELSPLPVPVRDAYLASQRLSNTAQRPDAQQTLDTVRREFDRASALFGSVLADELAARLQLAADEASRREAALGSEVESARRRAHELAARAERAEHDLAQLRTSTSWRLTAPVRAFKLGVVRAGQALAAPPAPLSAEPDSDTPRCLVATTAHALFTAELLAKSLQAAGFAVDMARDRVGDTGAYQAVFAVCPQNFPDLPDGYYAVQMEQHVASRWFTPGYFELLARAAMIFDYSQQNIAYLQAQGVAPERLTFLPLDANPDLLPAAPASKNFDVLFYGNENCPRRLRLLEALGQRFSVAVVNDLFDEAMRDTIRRAKLVLNIHFYDDGLLETNRLFEALSLGTPVVSEVGSDQAEHAALAGIVDFAPLGDIDQLATAIDRLLNDDAHYAARQAAIQQFVGRPDNRFGQAMSSFLASPGLAPSDTVSAASTGARATRLKGTVAG